MPGEGGDIVDVLKHGPVVFEPGAQCAGLRVGAHILRDALLRHRIGARGQCLKPPAQVHRLATGEYHLCQPRYAVQGDVEYRQPVHFVPELRDDRAPRVGSLRPPEQQQGGPGPSRREADVDPLPAREGPLAHAGLPRWPPASGFGAVPYSSCFRGQSFHAPSSRPFGALSSSCQPKCRTSVPRS